MTLVPQPAVHNSACQRAAQAGCVCPCRGMMHQNNVLVAAVAQHGTTSEFWAEVDRLFGSQFVSATSPPVANQRVRRGGWDASAQAASAKFQSQVEKRVVDVTLGNVLMNVHGLQASAQQRTNWLTLMDILTGRTGQWQGLSSLMTSLSGAHNRQSGYFWAAMLAATSNATFSAGTLPSSAQIQFHASASAFARVSSPRAWSGNRVKTISEMQVVLAVRSAADRIANALAAIPLSQHEALLVLTVTGAAISADLWRQPQAVKHLLLPAVTLLRSGHGQVFSLDGPPLLTEDVIVQEVGSKWQARGAWWTTRTERLPSMRSAGG